MDSIAGIIWVFIVFAVVISNINKAKKKTDTQKKTSPRASKPTPIEEFLSSTGGQAPQAPAAKPTVKPAVSSRYTPFGSETASGSLPPTQPWTRTGSLNDSTLIPQGVDPCHEEDLHGPDLKPTIYGTTRKPYTGSLGANTGEGFDPCHEDQADFMTVLETEDVSSEGSAPALAFNWTGPEIQKAVVMQEILRRR